MRKFFLISPEPSLTGFSYILLKTSFGIWSLNGFNNFSSSPEGKPDEAKSELEKKLSVLLY